MVCTVGGTKANIVVGKTNGTITTGDGKPATITGIGKTSAIATSTGTAIMVLDGTTIVSGINRYKQLCP